MLMRHDVTQNDLFSKLNNTDMVFGTTNIQYLPMDIKTLEKCQIRSLLNTLGLGGYGK